MEQVKAGPEHNVSGWAWSSNIGWISFNSTNCDPNGDGFSEGVPTGCPGTTARMARSATNYTNYLAREDLCCCR